MSTVKFSGQARGDANLIIELVSNREEGKIKSLAFKSVLLHDYVGSKFVFDFVQSMDALVFHQVNVTYQGYSVRLRSMILENQMTNKLACGKINLEPSASTPL